MGETRRARFSIPLFLDQTGLQLCLKTSFDSLFVKDRNNIIEGKTDNTALPIEKIEIKTVLNTITFII